MRLLILGASGRCGRWLTRIASARGHEVTVLVRPTARVDDLPGVTVLRGSVLSGADLERAVEGQQAVASCLGLRRAGFSPWAPLRSPPDLTERVTRLLIEAMKSHDVGRLVVISAGGVGDSRAQLSAFVSWLIRQGNIAASYRDLAAMEEVLAASNLDWLVVRPVTLVPGPPTGRAGPVARYSIWSAVRRSDVAAWMLDALERAAPFEEHAVLLGTG